MPELPEVEVVRRGLEEHLAGRFLTSVRVIDARSVRRHTPGPNDFIERLEGRKVESIARRGKYLWWVLDDGSTVVVHLGMSGQVLVADEPASHRHARIEFTIDSGRYIQFQDQRIFGGMFLDDTDPPEAIAHIALDPLDPDFDDEAFSRRVRKRTAGVKRALLDQALVSGIGNIYADEALWRTRLHYERACDRLRPARVRELLGHVRDVMTEALAQGGTSFDALYVNVNGNSGYFARHLAVYGREGGECQRCGSQIVREPFMNRSSYRCPRCQPTPPLAR